MNVLWLKQKALVALWFVIVPLALAIGVTLALSQLGWIDFAPWSILLGFAAFEAILLVLRDRAPGLAETIGIAPEDRASRTEGKLQKVIREAKHLSRETKRILAKHGHRLEDAVFREVTQAHLALDQALEARDADAILKAFRRLDLQVDEHLAFARKSTLREYAESIGVAVFVALVLRAFVVEAFKIPSGSMIPTLEVGDHIFVNKYLYGLRVPMTNVRLFDARSPRRGEVVVFIFPQDTSKDFIKRIVGIPGDKIQVVHGRLYINDHAVPRCPLGVWPSDDVNSSSTRWEHKESDAYLEALGGYRYVTIYERGPLGGGSDSGPTYVPPGQVFAMGDNRDNSHDSRYWGGVPFGNIKGRALFIWWSVNPVRGFQWSRLFHSVMGEPRTLPSLDAAFRRCEQELQGQPDIPPPARPSPASAGRR